MRRICLILCAAAAAGAAFAHDDHKHGEDHAHEAERRELGAHVHGEGALSMAFEGGAVAIALESPGMDIVGFEHPATSDADRAAVEAAKARLAEPLSLFVMPAAAGCTVQAATVTLLGEDDHDDHGHDDHGHGHEDHGHDEHAHDDDHAAEAKATHTEFRADYTLDCAQPGRIDSVGFAYFDAFPSAQKLRVTMASDSGQMAAEVTRNDPTLALDGAM